jgi:valyl-tRNA synthetase
MAMFSPICPFFTHHISTTLYGSSAVDVREFPAMPVELLAAGSDEGKAMCNLTQTIIDFNSDTWKTKKDAGVSLNQPIGGIIIPEKLVNIEADADFTEILTSMHSLE